MAASLMSLAFLVAHARAWPFVADDKNRMKLGTSAATAADDSTYHGIDLEVALHLSRQKGSLMLHLPSCSHGDRADDCLHADGPALRRTHVSGLSMGPSDAGRA